MLARMLARMEQLMPRKKSFVDKIHELKAAPGKRITAPVPGCDGLYVRATNKGKSFTVVARRARDKKQIWRALPIADIGVDIHTLTEARLERVRQMALDAISKIRLGEDPFPPPTDGPNSLQKVGDNFLKRYVKASGLASAYEIERQFNTYLYPALGDRPINEIRRSEIASFLDDMEDNNGATQADRVLGNLRKCFTWYAARDDDFNSPIISGMTRTKPSERRRTRVMTDEEIGILWPILTASRTYGALVKTLLLTAQRLDKVRSMKWTEIEDGVWTIPVSHRREKASAGKLPLPDLVIEIIAAQPKITGNPFVFSASRGNGYFNGYSKAKTMLDEKLVTALAEERGVKPGDVELDPWVLHSLRHTAKTIMARIGVSEFDSERTLGHVVGGIGGTCNHHDFTEEKGAALGRLATAIQRVVDPPEEDEKVMPFGRAAE